MKFKFWKRIFCVVFSLCLLLSFVSCKKADTESTLSEEIVYEYIDETENAESDNADITSTESQNNSKDNASSSTPASTNSKKVYKSADELFEADPAVGTIITLDIKPYAKGEYKVVTGSYVANDVSIVYISSGKYAVRNVSEINACDIRAQLA